MTNRGTETVSVFINNGDGTFAAKVDYTTGTTPQGVAIGDLNGDGCINGADVAMMRGAFGDAAGAGAGLGAIDLDGDGVVDVTDLALMGSNWGRGG